MDEQASAHKQDITELMYYLPLTCDLRYNLRICDLEEKGAHIHSKSTAS